MTHDWLRIDSTQSAADEIERLNTKLRLAEHELKSATNDLRVAARQGRRQLADQIQQLITEALDTTLDVSDPIVHNRLLVHYLERIEGLLR